MRIGFVASEAVPFVKTGGLADVAGSLPKALAALGHDVRVFLPKYYQIPQAYREKMEHVWSGEINVAWRRKFIGIDRLEEDGVTWYFIDNEDYFRRDSLYGSFDDAERFSFFCRGVLTAMGVLDFFPDILHANDWHSALVPVLLRLEHIGDGRYESVRSVFTIHNLKYQGVFDKGIMPDVLGLDWKYFNNGDLEYYDAVNFMKGGIIYADMVTTVSRTYADEIQYEYFGEGLHELLRSRAELGKLTGIVNGIDNESFDPRTDRRLVYSYGVEDIHLKFENKAALQHQLGLPESRCAPMISMVTRLVEAKGLDLVMRVIDELLSQENMQFVLLGVGDAVYEAWFRELAWRHPDKVSVNLSFASELAQRIYAASDIFLMPSKYEPCGIGQLIAMRYGAVPIVRATGGLKDTVEQYDKLTGKGNGFVFPNYNAHELLFTMKRALSLYKDMTAWSALARNSMKSDFGWKRSAKEYIRLYEGLKHEG
jgi:starch synthase